MISFDIKWVDIKPNIAAQVQPVAVLPRPRGEKGPMGRHWVVDELKPDGDVSWAPTASGDGVRVPMWAFKTVARGQAAVWGLGIEMGLRLMAEFHPQTGGERPMEITLYLAESTTDLFPENAERCYVGIAVRTQ